VKNLAWLTIFKYDLMMILDSGLLFFGPPCRQSKVAVDAEWCTEMVFWGSVSGTRWQTNSHWWSLGWMGILDRV